MAQRFLWCTGTFSVRIISLQAQCLQKMVLDLNQDSDDIHRSQFSPQIWIQENSAYAEFGFRLKSGFMKIWPTQKFPLHHIYANPELWLKPSPLYTIFVHHICTPYLLESIQMVKTVLFVHHHNIMVLLYTLVKYELIGMKFTA